MKPAAKQMPALNIKPEISKRPSAPSKKTGLSKSDPDFYKKLGALSAKKRNISPEQFAEWAKKGAATRDKSTYKGGRKKKVQ